MIYLDAQASTPPHPSVKETMIQMIQSDTGANPHSIHFLGQQSMHSVDEARKIVSDTFGVAFSEVVFTSGATESNNIAIQGVILQALQERDCVEVITTPIEHSAVLEVLNTLRYRYSSRVIIHYLPVDSYGCVSLDDLKSLLNPQTVLVSVMHANNEIGTIQPIKPLATLIKNFRGVGKYPVFHSDGAQAAWSEPLNLSHTAIDIYTISGHKMYGPKGVGLLLIRTGTPIQPITFGGGQEYGMRPGTINPLLVSGLATACRQLGEESHLETIIKVKGCRDKLQEYFETIPGITINGHPHLRLPHNLHLTIPNISAESLIIACDLEGVAISAGSACHSGALEPSHVLLALGKSTSESLSSIRVSLHQFLTEDDILKVQDIFSTIFLKHHIN